jgi:hypothetical protein
MAVMLAAMLPACGLVHPVDPEDGAERAVAGAALGTGLGATFAINPGVGSIIGAETGAALGAATGAITAAPVPDYKPIPAVAASTYQLMASRQWCASADDFLPECGVGSFG